MWWVGIFSPVLHSPMLDYGLIPFNVTFSYLSVSGFTSYGTDVELTLVICAAFIYNEYYGLDFFFLLMVLGTEPSHVVGRLSCSPGCMVCLFKLIFI